ncbi:hypothetical protein [Priestia koreensis]|nr:hypothetical protein [Priestia koreensis]
MVRIKKLGELKSERERKRLQARLEKVEEVVAPPEVVIGLVWTD